MAQPGGENLDDVLRELESLGKQTEGTRRAIEESNKQAARTGGRVVPPTTRAPTEVVKPGEANRVIAAARAESSAHESLARAIKTHETARIRLAATRKQLAALEAQDTPEATLASGRLQRTIAQ